jgi:hypothetical protein
VERVDVAAANLFPFSPMQLIRYDHLRLFPSVVEGKTRGSGESRGRPGTDRDSGLGIVERALNKPRNLTSTTPLLQRHLKNKLKKNNKTIEKRTTINV